MTAPTTRITIFHKLNPSNSCPVSGAALALLCSRGCRFLRCYGYRRVVIHDHAATSLAEYLGAIILIRSGEGGAVVVINATAATAATPQIAVGYDAARLLGCSPDALAGLGREGYIMAAALPAGPGSLALSGGRGALRGTLYAVTEFLETIGVEFLAADATVLPKELPQSLPPLRARFVPKLEYRQVYGYQFLTSQEFNVHLRTNKAHFNIPAPTLDEAHGGVYPIYRPCGSGSS